MPVLDWIGKKQVINHDKKLPNFNGMLIKVKHRKDRHEF